MKTFLFSISINLLLVLFISFFFSSESVYSKEGTKVKRSVASESGTTNQPATEGGGNKIIKYKEYEKFQFDDLDISGDSSDEGQISITPREQKKFANPLPKKSNFNREMKQMIQTIN